MSPREGINLLCTNRGLISPLRACVREGGSALNERITRLADKGGVR